MLKEKTMTSDVNNSVSEERTRRPKKVAWHEVEPIINLVKNTLHMNDSEVQRAVGLSDSNFAGWRRVGFVPAWFPYALRGLLSEHDVTKEVGELKIGMRFTNDQLDLLNIAVAEYTYGKDPSNKSYSDLKKLRSTILLELAGRLDE